MFDWLPDGSGARVRGGRRRALAPAGRGRRASPRRRAACGRAGRRAGGQPRRHSCRLRRRPAPRRRRSPSTARSWPVLLSDGNDFALDPAWSPDSAKVAWHEWDVPAMPWDASRIAVRSADGAGAVEVVAGGAGIAVAQPRWSASGRLGFLSDAARLAERPHHRRVRSSTSAVEHGPPAWGHGIRTWCWSPDGAAVAWTRNCDGFGELVVDGDVVDRGVHHGLTWRADRLAAMRSGARTPTQLVVHDLAPAPRRRAATPRPRARRRLGGARPARARGAPLGRRRRRRRRRSPVRRSGDAGRTTAAALLDPRRPDGPAPGHLRRSPGLVPRPGLGRAGARPPRVDRPRPGLHPGHGRTVGRARRRRLRGRCPSRPRRRTSPIPIGSP